MHIIEDVHAQIFVAMVLYFIMVAWMVHFVVLSALRHYEQFEHNLVKEYAAAHNFIHEHVVAGGHK